MKWKTRAAAVLLTAVVLMPLAGNAEVQVHAEKGWKHGHGMHHEKRKEELLGIIDLYASGQLKADLKQQLETRETLMRQLHDKMQTPAGQARMEERRKEMKEKMEAHREQMENIRKQVQDGKMTMEQARSEFGKIMGARHEGHAVYQEVREAAAKQDQAAAEAALQKLKQHLQAENDRLKKEIAAIQ